MRIRKASGRGWKYPEIHLQVSGASKFAIAHLEGDGHLVIFVELLVETFPGVSANVDIVGCCNGREEKDQGWKDGGHCF